MRLSGNVLAYWYSNTQDYAVKRYAIKWVDLYSYYMNIPEALRLGRFRIGGSYFKEFISPREISSSPLSFPILNFPRTLP